MTAVTLAVDVDLSMVFGLRPDQDKKNLDLPRPIPAMPHEDDDARRTWNVPAALLAWLLPGLGHWMIGQPRRAAILAGGIGGIWVAGLLIGGLAVVDHKTHPAWFMAQSLTAPTLLVHVVARNVREQELRTRQPIHRPSFGRVKEQGILYTALAGLLNLLAVIDVLHRDPRAPDLARRRHGRGTEAPP